MNLPIYLSLFIYFGFLLIKFLIILNLELVMKGQITDAINEMLKFRKYLWENKLIEIDRYWIYFF